MRSTMLLIDDEARAKAAEIVRYAEAHVYGRDAIGHIPDGHVGTFNNHLVVYSLRTLGRHTMRHLSVSLQPLQRGSYPNPISVYMIASHLFGFTGWTEARGHQPPEGCAVVADDDPNHPIVSLLQAVEIAPPKSEQH